MLTFGGRGEGVAVLVQHRKAQLLHERACLNVLQHKHLAVACNRAISLLAAANGRA